SSNPIRYKRYMGIDRVQARLAVENGWKRDTLVWLNHELTQRNLPAALFMQPWAFIVDNRMMIYRSYTPADIHRVFVDYVDRDATVYAYTDGSGTTKDKPSGIGVAVYRNGHRPLYIAENIGNATNNLAELRAIWRALQSVPHMSTYINIYSDSEYAIGSVTKPWNQTQIDNKEVAEAIKLDLAERTARGAVITINHIEGHAGHE